MRRVTTIVFRWRLWHACGIVFWTVLVIRSPPRSLERILLLIPFVIHGALLFSKVPKGQRPPDNDQPPG